MKTVLANLVLLGHNKEPLTDIEKARCDDRSLSFGKHDKEADAGLRTDIAVNGIIVPLIVRPVIGEAKLWEVVDGARRYMAALAVDSVRLAEGQKPLDIPIQVVKLTDVEALRYKIKCNGIRLDDDPVTLSTRLSFLVQCLQKTGDGHMESIRKVAADMGCSEGKIRNYLKIGSLPDTVKARLTAKEIGIATAVSLAGLGDDAVIEQAAQAIVTKGLGTDAKGSRSLVESVSRGREGAAQPVKGEAPNASASVLPKPASQQTYARTPGRKEWKDLLMYEDAMGIKGGTRTLTDNEVLLIKIFLGEVPPTVADALYGALLSSGYDP